MPIQNKRGIDPSKGVECVQGIAVDHGADQEIHQAFAFVNRLQCRPEISQGCAHSRALAGDFGIVADPHEEGDHENDEPDRDEWTDKAGAFAQFRIKPKQRLNAEECDACVTLCKEQQHDEK